MQTLCQVCFPHMGLCAQGIIYLTATTLLLLVEAGGGGGMQHMSSTTEEVFIRSAASKINPEQVESAGQVSCQPVTETLVGRLESRPKIIPVHIQSWVW